MFVSVFKEPGVYAVFVTAILQDAVLSVKIASNMLEREVLNKFFLMGHHLQIFRFLMLDLEKVLLDVQHQHLCQEEDFCR